MNDSQIKQIADAIYICKDEIVTKLEELRCDIIDVENELIKLNKIENNQEFKTDKTA